MDVDGCGWMRIGERSGQKTAQVRTVASVCLMISPDIDGVDVHSTYVPSCTWIPYPRLSRWMAVFLTSSLGKSSNAFAKAISTREWRVRRGVEVVEALGADTEGLGNDRTTLLENRLSGGPCRW